MRDACDDIQLRHPGVEIVTVEYPWPIHDEQQLVDMFIDPVEQLVQAGKTPRLAIVDAISSFATILFPFVTIVREMKKRGVEHVFVDGAHSLGQIDIDLELIGADYYVGNCHKWLFGPKGTCLFYVAPQHQQDIRPPIVSYNEGKRYPERYPDILAGKFVWLATRDPTSFSVLGESLKFIENCGGLVCLIGCSC